MAIFRIPMTYIEIIHPLHPLLKTNPHSELKASTMKRSTTRKPIVLFGLALLAGICLSGMPAQAAFVQIDNFDDAQGPVSYFGAVNGVGASSTQPGANILFGERDVFVIKQSGPDGTLLQPRVILAADDPTVPGTFFIDRSASVGGTVVIQWDGTRWMDMLVDAASGHR